MTIYPTFTFAQFLQLPNRDRRRISRSWYFFLIEEEKEKKDWFSLVDYRLSVRGGNRE